VLRKKKYVVRRYEGNPILTGKDFPNDIVTVFNSAVVKQGPKRYTMICRCEDSALGRYMWIADSPDGIHFKPRPAPVAMPKGDPVFDEYCHETWSYWDPRCVKLGRWYYVTHAAHTRHGCALGLFRTDASFDKFEWLGLIMPPDNRNGVLFPEKIGGRYVMLHRPNVSGCMDTWIGSSPDLVNWGNHRCLVRKSATGWSYTKIGPGAVPIKTPEGWLCIIHGVRTQCAQHYVYQLGVMLLDLADPYRVLGVSRRAILQPEEMYELVGQTPSVVFTNAAIPEPDGTVKIYYGGADTVQCLAFADIHDLIYAAKHE
jgi:predicted GH43/DUF377 family glycosyl hydrolase